MSIGDYFLIQHLILTTDSMTNLWQTIRRITTDILVVKGMTYQTTLTFCSQDLSSNPPFYLPHNSYDVSTKNLVLDQLIIPN